MDSGPEGLSPEGKQKLQRIAEAANDPQKMAALLGQGQEEEAPEAAAEEPTEADEELERGPETEDPSSYAREAAPEVEPEIVEEEVVLPPPEKLDDPEVVKAIADLYEALEVPPEQIGPAIEEARAILAEGPAQPPAEAPKHPLAAQFLKLAEAAEKAGDQHSAAIYRRQAR
jgi:hypothetical protein